MPQMLAVLRWVLLLLLWGAAQGAIASVQDPTLPDIAVSDIGTLRIEVGSGMGVLVDPSGALTLDQVRASSGAWKTIDRPSPNFGFTTDTYWFRFQLHNLDMQPLQRLIELPIPFLDHVQLFHLGASELLTQYTLGDTLPFAQRPVRHRNFVMPVSLAPGINTIYLRLASSGTIEGPLRIWEPQNFYATSMDEILVHGGVIGILLIMVVYNLFIYFSTRDISYIYYVAFVAFYLMFHLSLTGYAFAYLWPNALHWNSFAIATFIPAAGMFVCLFTDQFLKLRNFSKPAFYVVRSLILCNFILLILTFMLPYSWTIRIGVGLTFPIILISLFLGYWSWWRGAQFARYYCLAWTAMLIGAGTLNASKQGWIGQNVWTENAPQIGIVSLVLLLSFTLADRINNDRNLRIRAQATALKHERKARASQQALIEAGTRANRELEAHVQIRTTDLNSALGQLQAANDRLLKLSTTDGLTQISNRAYFDGALEKELRRAQRMKTSLAVIMFDIDHFKKINDTYGHLTGDACLRALANLIGPRINRAGDIFARYGGEEFVIVLPNVDLTQSLGLAEGLRKAITDLRVTAQGHTVAFTASFGVVSTVPPVALQIGDLLAAADGALYEAKHRGRNCVRSASIGT